jgi:hypothetical protein
MEGMTELIDGTFIEDLSAILSSCAEGKKRKTFFEIDKEFEIMMVLVKSNFVSGLFPSVYADVSVSWGFMAYRGISKRVFRRFSSIIL